MSQPIEVDRDSPASDHLGDYVELSNPYPSSRAAWDRATERLPGDAHADPDEVRQDMGQYAAAPHKQGTQTRPVTASLWYPAGRILTDGVQAFLLVEEDPQRTRTVITNHADSGLYLAPTPTRSPGDGALFVPGFDWTAEIRATGRIYLFTTEDFVAGEDIPVHVQVLTERWG